VAQWQAAAERALVHYRRSGWSASGCLAELAAALLHGPTHVSEALGRCEELLGEASDRAGRANVLAFLGGLEALEGRFDDARRRLEEASTTYAEIGEHYALANNSGRVLGRVEMLFGDHAAAERAFHDCCRTFDRIQDRPGLSTVAAELADALYEQGRYAEAAGWLDLAREHSAGEDVRAQYIWGRVQAKLLARRAAFDEAATLGLEAAALAAKTDALDDRGTVLLDLAEVLRLSDRVDEATTHVEKALSLFERKGNVISARHARSMLTERTVA
jgi:tetratricopeptide (TPR) repeat protein